MITNWRTAAVVMIVALLAGCSRTSAPATLDKWSWLPKTTAHDLEAAGIPADARLRHYIPEDDPIDAGSDGGWGGIDTFGNFVPKDRDSYVVKGGSLVSSIGGIERRAKFSDWDVIYADADRKQRAGWGHCLTSGELIVERQAFPDPPANLYVQNHFAIETFGPTLLLITLDPARKHKLCFMESGGGQPITAGFVGSKADVADIELERRADGWYSGTTRYSN
jgi:hypothetical protein